MNILLVCSAGVSTSLLVSSMEDFAEKDWKIAAKSVELLESLLMSEHFDCVMVGPQQRHRFTKIKILCDKFNTPCDLISMKEYGTLDGEKVLIQTKNTMDNYKK